MDDKSVFHTVNLGTMVVDNDCMEAINRIKKKHRMTDEEFGRVAAVTLLMVYNDSRSTVDIDLSDPEKTKVDIQFITTTLGVMQNV